MKALAAVVAPRQQIVEVTVWKITGLHNIYDPNRTDTRFIIVAY